MEKAFAINNRKKSKKPVPGRRNTFHIVRCTIPGGEEVFKRQKGLCFTCGNLRDGAHSAKDGFT
jgi:hypothetical protein